MIGDNASSMAWSSCSNPRTSCEPLMVSRFRSMSWFMPGVPTMPLLNHRRIYSTNSVCSEMYVLT